jgi:hypothetical protein
LAFGVLQKNKVEIRGVFLALQKADLSHHVKHPNHHVMTTKKPRRATTFFETPLKKPRKNTKDQPRTTANFFLVLNS